MEEFGGDGGGAALVGEGKDFDVEVSGFRADLEFVANFDDAGRFGDLGVAGDFSCVAGGGGEGTGFEEARGPKPLVDAEWALGRVGKGFCHSDILVVRPLNLSEKAEGGEL